MSRPRMIPIMTVALLAASLWGVGAAKLSRPPIYRPQEKPPARAQTLTCPILSGPYTTLEVGTRAMADPKKKVTDDCWWQFPVGRIDGTTGLPLGWQICNACNVPVDFKFRAVASDALSDCDSLFFDASGESFPPLTVPPQSIRTVDCTGIAEVHGNMYEALARRSGDTSEAHWVHSDPELEIEDRHMFPVTGYLAQIGDLKACRRADESGSTRVTVSGKATRRRASGSVVFVRSGPLFGESWGGDLLEIVATKDVGPKPPEASFSINVYVPSFVREFVLRSRSGLQRTSMTAMPQCRR
jgi:hypothetical protein